MRLLVCLLILLSLKEQLPAQESCPVIPHPVSAVIRQSGVFILDNKTNIEADTASSDLKVYLSNEITRITAITPSANTSSGLKKIRLINNTNSLAKEGYQINITPSIIEVRASYKDGFFYGVITLLQLIEYAPKEKQMVRLACWQIQDQPRYAWRGFLLDESRHFFGVQKVKQLLNRMAYYKLNRFHWHLTDVQGWRLPVSQYPDLTLKGGIGNHTDPAAPARYYTKEEIKDILAYATERHITIIPEIDMPGHATAAVRAYPEYNGGGSKEYPDFTFNPGSENTYAFLSQVLRETMKLFPARMIHVGGDEVSYGAEAWKSNEQVKRLMQEKGFATLQETEHYFLRRMADTVISAGRKVLAWDEAVDAGLPVGNTLIFWWRHDKPLQLAKALEKGYPVILCPRLPLYFDFVQDTTHATGRKWNKQVNTLADVYNFPTENALYQNGQVWGIQANLWTETIYNNDRFDFMVFPRIAALSEACWVQPHAKNYAIFTAALKKHLTSYKKEAILYYDPFDPLQNIHKPQ